MFLFINLIFDSAAIPWIYASECCCYLQVGTNSINKPGPHVVYNLFGRVHVGGTVAYHHRMRDQDPERLGGTGSLLVMYVRYTMRQDVRSTGFVPKDLD